jgi:hypothetical protein
MSKPRQLVYICESIQLEKILMVSSVRARAVIGLMAFAGLTDRSLRKMKLRDIRDIVVGASSVRFKRTPVKIWFKPPRRQRCFTFLSKEGCRYLALYLKQRIRGGEKLAASSRVIKGAWKPVWKEIDETAHKAGFDYTIPWSFYHYFEHNIGEAVSKKEVPKAYFDFWRGIGHLRVRAGVGANMLRVYRKAARKYLATPLGNL